MAEDTNTSAKIPTFDIDEATALADITSHPRELFYWELDVNPLRACVLSLMSDAITPAATVFQKSIENIRGLAGMPLGIVINGLQRFALGVFQIKAAKVLGVDEAHPDVLKKAKEYLNAERENKTFSDMICGNVRASINDIAGIDSLREAGKLLLHAIVTQLWTAYECLVRDLWIAAVNAGSATLSQRAFNGIDNKERDDGISRKAISVGHLARYGFDIKNKVGDLLVSKFEFSDVDGMKKAYVSVFENADEFDTIFGHSNLRQLAKSRHLIVHRAAIIDEKYRKESQCSQAIGEELNITALEREQYAQDVIRSGIALIGLIDRLSARRSVKN